MTWLNEDGIGMGGKVGPSEPPRPADKGKILLWALKLTSWLRQSRVIPGDGLTGYQTPTGYFLDLKDQGTPTLAQGVEFQCYQSGPSSITFREGRYGVVGSEMTTNPETVFTVTTNGTYGIYVKYTYGDVWETNVVEGVTTILIKDDIGSVPDDSATSRIILVQSFSVTDGVIVLNPQSWVGQIWCYDFGACG